MAIRHYDALGHGAQRLAKEIASAEIEPFLGDVFDDLTFDVVDKSPKATVSRATSS
jgi:hypothetical protein